MYFAAYLFEDEEKIGILTSDRLKHGDKIECYIEKIGTLTNIME